jgi:hypothetical protein
LTGFRKRKQERIKHGQAAAEKRYKEERRHDRAKVSSASCRILCPRVESQQQRTKLSFSYLSRCAKNVPLNTERLWKSIKGN